MKNSIILLLLSITLVNAQVSTSTTATTNVNITITPKSINGKSSGIIDTTNVAYGDKAGAYLVTNPLYVRSMNTMIGIKAMTANVIGDENLALGNNTLLESGVSNYSTAIGVQALSYIGTSNSGNVHFGTATGYYVMSKANSVTSVAFGAKSLYTINLGDYNIAMGANALYSTTGKSNNTAIGAHVLYNNLQGADNTGVGSSAIYTSVSASLNTAVGASALIVADKISSSVAIGTSVLDSVTTAYYNTGIGANVFVRHTIGYNNVAFGHNAMYVGNKSTQNLAIGSYAQRECDYCETNTAIGAEVLAKNTQGSQNTALGYRALYDFTPVDHYNVSSVVAGSMALYHQTNGGINTAFGAMALYSNTIGKTNTAVGTLALSAHDGVLFGSNLAVGSKALLSNTTGSSNTAIGTEVLGKNTTGVQNTAAGINALRNNITGQLNAGVGVNALYNYSGIGMYNNAVGKNAGYTLTAGSNNTFFGSFADVSAAGNFTNVTAIGANAIVNASNKVRIGDANVTVIEGQVPWSNPSDRSLKENIVYTNRLGLDFINQLQTVSYNYKTDKTQTRIDGFIAQDIESVMQNANVPFSGLKKSDDGFYSLVYTDFIMPLVNAKKEQDKRIDNLEKEIIAVENQNKLLLTKLGSVTELKARINELRK